MRSSRRCTEDLDGDLVADLEDLVRVVDAAPAHVGDVEQAVDAAEVDERAVLGDVLDDAANDHASLGIWGLALRSRSCSRSTRREHDVAALLVELDDLESVGLADQLVEVADRAEVDLGAREERLHAALDGDREAALHALADGASCPPSPWKAVTRPSSFSRLSMKTSIRVTRFDGDLAACVGELRGRSCLRSYRRCR